jgi:hypothetical protein
MLSHVAISALAGRWREWTRLSAPVTQMSTNAEIQQTAGGGVPARTTLARASGALLVAMLIGALYIFAGTIHAHGLKGAALIYDIYTKGLPGCL